ncbi:LacI family DNA-binding transcriptional regulator [Streptomyces litchfieldiae]|uniref:LacI family DNA-binding transcriptional regulator n=1 Tax=Streptomyces litchfieldiae TaxID=3075543 RepID=A0ABU2MX05_9ACTN|nr:LacI family DNA-binding transcriptional regulator [Streptomyces sp. DSM 44938]MDT0345368.1 LacI family DNA-binding transcriptional regulator [Streptomyces sp. DSM 44938]
MRRRTVTLKDVARAANVSPSTASEALSGTGRMTEATRAAARRCCRPGSAGGSPRRTG